MKKKLFLGLCSAFAMTLASPAAAVVIGATGVTLGSNPTTFTFGSSAFAFSYDATAAAAFNPDTYSVQTFGTAQTSAFGGFLGIPLTPSLFFTSANVLIDNSLFPSFASFPALSPIPDSLTSGDLALRYTRGADTFFGYARFNGDSTLDFAFENVSNRAITAGAAISGPLPAAVPEPATWAMMLVGFAAVGYGMRRRMRNVVLQAA